MGKSLRRIATIVGVAGLAMTGIGLLVGPAAAAMASGSALGAIAGAAHTIGLPTLLGIGVAGLSIGSMPVGQPIENTGANARGTAYADPEALGAYVFGRTSVPRELAEEERSSSRDRSLQS